MSTSHSLYPITLTFHQSHTFYNIGTSYKTIQPFYNSFLANHSSHTLDTKSWRICWYTADSPHTKTLKLTPPLASLPQPMIHNAPNPTPLLIHTWNQQLWRNIMPTINTNPAPHTFHKPCILAWAKIPKPSSMSGMMGVQLPFWNTYHKGFSLFMKQTRYYAPDENSCLFWWADHDSRSHSH